MNNYTIRYTIWKKDQKGSPDHKQYTFTTENDLLAAADEGMSKLFDDHPDHEILFRTVELNNAKEVYESLTASEASA